MAKPATTESAKTDSTRATITAIETIKRGLPASIRDEDSAWIVAALVLIADRLGNK